MVAGIATAFDRAADEAPLFAQTLRRTGKIAAKASRAMEPDAVADVVLTALTKHRPRSSYSFGHDRGRAILDRLPSRLSEAIVRRALTR